MPQVLEPIEELRETAPPRLHLTQSHCATLEAAGLLTQRYELIDGEIISKMGQNPPHATATGLLSDWLIDLFGSRFVRVQQNSDVGSADPEHNRPEPDVAVTREARRAYAQQHPGPDDILLIAEVADTTLRFDRSKKAALYAAAGYQEFWLVDVNSRQLLVHRDPSPEGYAEIIAYREDEMVATLAHPEVSVMVSELLP